jgi:hypothetical protein
MSENGNGLGVSPGCEKQTESGNVPQEFEIGCRMRRDGDGVESETERGCSSGCGRKV